MPDASQAITSFLGGEISPYAQGRFDRPDYKISLNVCLNCFPVEIGALVRRPGTQYGGHTRGGSKGRAIEFDFEQSTPSTLEFTDGWMRFRNGPTLLTTNDTQTVVAISTANPAVVQTAAANTWVIGNTVIFPPGVPLLENRQFAITQIDTTHFSLQDALTGANIDGSTLGGIPALTVQRVQELQTVYGAGSWSSATMRSVQAETTTFLLNNAIAPQAVTVSSLPTPTANALFSIGAVNFIDGPYLNPFTNGVQVTPSAKSGIISLTLAFPAYSATTVYPNKSFVTSGGSNYVSLVDQNLNNTPASSPSQWALTSAGAAINNGAGFSSADVGRLVRLFSEPAAWASGTTYAAGNVVLYNPSGIPGEETYWSSLVGSNVGVTPGTDLTKWSLLSTNASLWSWGKITGLSNVIPGSTGTNIGTMVNNAGLTAAFDGNLSKSSPACAAIGLSHSGFLSGPTPVILAGYVGKNYGGQQIQQVTVYPSTDLGYGFAAYGANSNATGLVAVISLNLRGKMTAPTASFDGTLLGTSTFLNTSAPTTIVSNDAVTSWNYVWVEQLISVTIPSVDPSGFAVNSYIVESFISQEVYTNPPGAGTGTGISVEILGPSLLYTNVITTWRLGAYGGPNGYPTVGAYASGRLWLGGAISNRFDASVANGINGSTVNFAPTDQFGVVADSAAISETLNSDSVNPINGMKPDAQGVVLFTQSAEWLIFAPSAGSISPTNIDSRRVTKHGSANLEPVRVPHANIFAKRYGRKLLENFADAYSGKYSAPNLSDKAAHILTNGIAELAYTDGTTPIIWGRDNLNNLFGITYKRDTLVTSQLPDFYGWHRHSLGTGRAVESICSGASVGGNLDALTLVTNDLSTNIRHVEVLTDIPNETTTLLGSWLLDDAVNPTSVINTGTGLTINGLWHLNGKTVSVFAGGLDCGDIGDLANPFIQNFSYSQNQYTRATDLNIYKSLVNKNLGNNPTTDKGVNWQLIGTGLDFVVANGSITVPYGDGVATGAGAGLFTAAFATALPLTEIVVGCTYNSDGQIVRPQAPAETGSRTGPAFSKISRDHFIGVQLVNTLGISFGTNFSSLTPARFTKEDERTPIDPLTTFSDVYTDIPNAKHSRNSERLCWRASRPLPFAIVAIGASRTTQDQ